MKRLFGKRREIDLPGRRKDRPFEDTLAFRPWEKPERKDRKK